MLYVAAGRLGLQFAVVHVSASAVWPATGVALASLLVLGARVWPAIFVGAFVVNVLTAGSVLPSLGIAAGNTLEAVAGAVLVTGALLAVKTGTVVSGIGAGMIGAVLGTMGGYRARKALVERNGGHDLPVALIEDVVAVVGGFGVVALAMAI